MRNGIGSVSITPGDIHVANTKATRAYGQLTNMSIDHRPALRAAGDDTPRECLRQRGPAGRRTLNVHIIEHDVDVISIDVVRIRLRTDANQQISN